MARVAGLLSGCAGCLACWLAGKLDELAGWGTGLVERLVWVGWQNKASSDKNMFLQKNSFIRKRPWYFRPVNSCDQNELKTDKYVY